MKKFTLLISLLMLAYAFIGYISFQLFPFDKTVKIDVFTYVLFACICAISIPYFYYLKNKNKSN